MAFAEEELLILSLLIFSLIATVSSRGAIYTPPTVPNLTNRFDHVLINQGYSEFFGHSNIRILNNGSNANLILWFDPTQQFHQYSILNQRGAPNHHAMNHSFNPYQLLPQK